MFASVFVFPTLLTPATNYFAGLSRFPVGRFTPAMAAGETVYVAPYVGLDWKFSSQVVKANSPATTASLLLLDLLLAGYFAFLVVWALRR